MAFFKFRHAGEDHTAPAPAPQSTESMRKRARHRLVGSAILVLLGVVGLPLVFDSQPRPIAVDIPIEIPDKAKTEPLRSSTPAASATTATNAANSAPSEPPATATRQSSGAIGTPAPASSPAAQITQQPANAASSKEALAKDAAMKEAATKEAAKNEANRAQALLDGKPPATKPAPSPAKEDKASDKTPKANDAGRFVVQFGSYTDATKAREARVRVEKAGLKTYAQVVQADGVKKFRVRVGPFERRADAQKAADKIKALDLPAAILEL